MSSGETGPGGYGVGLWVLLFGVVIAILTGILLTQFDKMNRLTAPDQYRLVLVAFLIGAAITVIGLLTAISERVVEYLAS